MYIMKEAYSKPNVSFVGTILKNLETELFKNRIVIDALELLNEKFKPYKIYFTMDEEYGHYWIYGDQDIQLSSIDDNGRIKIIVGDEFLEKNEGSSFKYLIQKLESIVSHELIHKQQILKTPYGKLKSVDAESDYSYLSDTREIDAHANEAIVDLLNYYDKKKIKQIISNYSLLKDHVTDSYALWKYWDHFGLYSDSDDDPIGKKVWNKFLKRMYYFLSL